MSTRARPLGQATAALACAALLWGCGGDDASAETEANASRPALTAAVPVAAISGTELLARLGGPDAPLVLDVRSPEEFGEGHVPGAVNVPYDQIEANLDSLLAFRDRDVVVYCRTGRRAGIAEARLREAGFERLWDLEGHMTAWVANELPVVVPAGDCC